MTDKSKLINYISLFFVVVFFTAIFAKFAYENRCHIISCSPASWERILNLTFAHSGSDFRVDYISAQPSRFGNSYSEAGPAFIDIDVSYISLKTDNSATDKKINHPVKHLEFDDQTLISSSRTGGQWANYVPPEDGREKLKRVTVHPRDAFRMTWMLAEKDSSLPATNAHVLALLGFNNLADKFGCESIWAVSYLYDHVALTYYINAQTGQIISSEKTSY